jgi:hypothetical protein
MSEEERVIIRLAADNKALRDLVDWQAAYNKRLREALRYMVENPEDLESFHRIASVALEGKE